MAVLNEFLRVICSHAETNEEIFVIMREFVEPDTNDRKISGGTVIRTVVINDLCLKTISELFKNNISRSRL